MLCRYLFIHKTHRESPPLRNHRGIPQIISSPSGSFFKSLDSPLDLWWRSHNPLDPEMTKIPSLFWCLLLMHLLNIEVTTIFAHQIPIITEKSSFKCTSQKQGFYQYIQKCISHHSTITNTNNSKQIIDNDIQDMIVVPTI